MSDLLKIKVNLADRVYPLTISRSDEENVRAAAKSIEATLKKFGQGYAVRDKQDLLAMCALQLASRLQKNKQAELVDGHWVEGALTQLENKITQALK